LPTNTGTDRRPAGCRPTRGAPGTVSSSGVGEEARARFARHAPHVPLGAETVTLAAALGRVLAHDVTAPIDVPPFDRASVDGFAVRASDTAGATDMGRGACGSMTRSSFAATHRR